MKTRRNRKNGGGYLTDVQYFNPEVLPPTAGFLPAPSTAPTMFETRPVLLATQVPPLVGGKRTRKHGGFVPSIMGGFIENAQAAIVPAALYLVYHTMVPKKLPKTVGGLMKQLTRKNRK